MAFVIYFTLSWFLIGWHLCYNSKLPFKLASFLFFFTCFIHTHAYHLLPENFKGFTVNGELLPYLSYIMWRSLIVPAFLVLCYKLFYYQKTLSMKLLIPTFFYAVTMTLLEEFGDILGIYTLQWWNFLWALFYYFCFFFLSFLLLLVFLRMKESEKHVG